MIRKLLEKLTFDQKVLLMKVAVFATVMMLIGLLGDPIAGAEAPHH